MPLDNEIEKMRKEIRTDGYPMSVGEWMSLYQNNEIDIHPEFQRFYRWSDIQKANLIESILLGIPIPPIFVSQRKDGVWDVVDGLQRLSTIYQFLGILRDEEGNLMSPLILEKTKYLPSLEGKKWDDKSRPDKALSQEARLLFKRAKISASIILKESDEKAKYELFQRLNTGGSRLTEQEVRNCVLVMINKDMFNWIKKLSDFEPFNECIALSERLIEEQYNLELVLRFLIFINIGVNRLSELRDLGNFLSDEMIAVAENRKYDFRHYEEIFKKTFSYINEKIGPDAFRKYNKEKARFQGAFSVSAYEVVAIGIGHNYKNIDGEDFNIVDRIKNLWGNHQFTNFSGMGKPAARRIPKLIPLGREIFAL